VDRTTSDPASWPVYDRCIYMCNRHHNLIKDLESHFREEKHRVDKEFQRFDIALRSQKAEINTLETRISLLEQLAKRTSITETISQEQNETGWIYCLNCNTNFISPQKCCCPDDGRAGY
jgi:hypothetical protein